MAFVAYLIFFIPLLMEEYKKNKFVMYHTEQAILVVILNIAGFLLITFFYIVFSLIVGVLGILSSVFFLINIFAFILWIIGIINALGGKVAPLPLIGQFGEKFNLVK